MADPIVYQPALETLAAFNARMGAFCKDPETPVVNVVASLMRASMVLSLSAPSDFPVPVTAVMQPVLFAVTEEQYAGLEATLVKFRDEALEWLTQAGQEPPLIMQMQVFDIPTEHRAGLPVVAYVLVIGIIGQLAFEDEPEVPASVTETGE